MNYFVGSLISVHARKRVAVIRQPLFLEMMFVILRIANILVGIYYCITIYL